MLGLGRGSVEKRMTCFYGQKKSVRIRHCDHIEDGWNRVVWVGEGLGVGLYCSIPFQSELSICFLYVFLFRFPSDTENLVIVLARPCYGHQDRDHRQEQNERHEIAFLHHH